MGAVLLGEYSDMNAHICTLHMLEDRGHVVSL